MRYLKVIFLIIVLPCWIFPQNIDSLINAFEKGDLDEKIAVMDKLYPALDRINTDSTFYFIEKMQAASIAAERKDGLAFTNIYFANFLITKSLYEEAQQKLLAAEDYFSYVENDSALADVYNTAGISHLIQGNLASAEEGFLRSIAHGKKAENPDYAVFSLSNLSRVYMRQKNYDKAEETISYYLDYYKNRNNNINIGTGYGLLGQLEMDQGNYNVASEHFERSLEVNLSAGYPLLVANGYTNMAIACFYNKDYDRSEQYFNLALSYRKSAGNDFFISESLHNLGDFYQGTENYEKALSYYEKVISLADSTNSKLAKLDAIREVANVHQALGDYKHQAAALESFIQVNDEVSKEKISKELSLLRFSYEQEREKLALERLKREESLKSQVLDVQRTWNYWFWILIALIAFSIVFYFWKSRKMKIKTKED